MLRMAGQTLERRAMTEKRKYRTFTPEQKLAIVLAGLRGDKHVRRSVATTRFPTRSTTSGATSCWRRHGRANAGAKGQASETQQLRRRVSQPERTLGRKTYELEIASELSRGWE
jgi:transposase